MSLVEILRTETKNVLSFCHRPTCGDIEIPTLNEKKYFILQTKKTNYILGDFNLNCLNYDINLEAWWQYFLTPYNKSTQVTDKTATLIDIFTNALCNKTL